MNIPNALTTLRFFLIGVFAFFYFNESITNNTLWAFATFIVAGLTDFLDGWIARRYDMVTDWGKLMDPLADKLMLITVLICLFVDGKVPLWIIIVIIAKELMMIVGAAFLFKDKDVVVQSNFYGKIATFLFYVAITFIVFDISYSKYVLWIAVFSTILALAQYAISAIKSLKESSHGKDDINVLEKDKRN